VLPGVAFVCIEHEGRNDLEKRLRDRLRAWRAPGDAFVVVRDQDADDCSKVKRRIASGCRAGGRPGALVRIACRELEAWYLGDLAALVAEYGERPIRDLRTSSRFRDPDAVVGPSRELRRRLPEFGKIDAARRMGARIALEGGRSRSFRTFVAGVRRLAGSRSVPEAE
jgi:hypothetical protein